MTTRRDSTAPGRVLGHAWAVRVAMVGLPGRTRWDWIAMGGLQASQRHRRMLWLTRDDAGSAAYAWRKQGYRTRVVRITFRGPR